MLKLCCLYEAKADRKNTASCATVPLPEAAMFLRYSRSHLLHCKEECERALDCIKMSRDSASLGGGADELQAMFKKKGGVGGIQGDVGPVKDGGDKDTMLGGRLVLEDLHAEFVYVLTRVDVKLASTIPPPGICYPLTAAIKLHLHSPRVERALQKNHIF